MDPTLQLVVYMGDIKMPKNITLSIAGTSPVINNVVVFRGDGSAKDGGSVQLTNRFLKTRTINVLPSTGRVKVLLQ